jgi:hypothetical protein
MEQLRKEYSLALTIGKCAIGQLRKEWSLDFTNVSCDVG